MNIGVARQQYSQNKIKSLTEQEQNVEAIRIALQQVTSAMKNFVSATTAEDREPHFEMALTRIYILQKCLDFEAGGDLAKNLFRIYEFARQSILNFKDDIETKKNVETAIEYLNVVYEGWREMKL